MTSVERSNTRFSLMTVVNDAKDGTMGFKWLGQADRPSRLYLYVASNFTARNFADR